LLTAVACAKKNVKKFFRFTLIKEGKKDAMSVRLDTTRKLWDAKGGNPMTDVEKASKAIQQIKSWTCLTFEKTESCPVHVIKRVGSASKESEVYLLELPGKNSVALKIMPTSLNAERDAAIASYLSQSSAQQWVPQVFAVLSDCKVTTLQPLAWLQRLVAERSLPTREAGKAKDAQTCKNAILVVMELAWGDLHQFANALLDAKVSYEDRVDIWQNILQQVETALDALHKVNVKHGDFHAGNVLVNPWMVKGKIIPQILITDFSQSTVGPVTRPHDDLSRFQLNLFDIPGFPEDLLRQ
jgi:serine/threonine protein kinase